jgi:hypothetical protein
MYTLSEQRAYRRNKSIYHPRRRMRQPVGPKLIRSHDLKPPHLRNHPHHSRQQRSRHTNPKHPPKRAGRNDSAGLIRLACITQSEGLEGADVPRKEEEDAYPEGAGGDDAQQGALEEVRGSVVVVGGGEVVGDEGAD